MIRHPITYLVYICNWRKSIAVALKFRIAVSLLRLIFIDLVNKKRTYQSTMNTTFLCMTNTHVLLAAHLGAFTLLAIPLSSLEKEMQLVQCETALLHQLEVTLDVATAENPYPLDRNGLGVLRINLSEPRKPLAGPWVLTVHNFSPVWKTLRPSARGEEEIYVVGFEKEGNISTADRLLSWRLRLSPSSSSQTRKPSEELVYDENDIWKLTLVQKSRTRASALPWNGKTITNSGRMLSLHKGISLFELFRDDNESEQSQPQRLLNMEEMMDELLNLKDTSYTLEAVDPWSGVLAIRSPENVKVLRFDI